MYGLDRGYECGGRNSPENIVFDRTNECSRWKQVRCLRQGCPREEFSYAGDVNDDHVAERVVNLALSGKVGVDERGVELICHDDFVC